MRMAVPPDLVGFAESAGLAAVAYGLDSQAVAGSAPQLLDAFLPQLLEDPGTDQVVARSLGARYAECWAEMSATLTSLADGADLLFTGHEFRAARCQRRGVLRHSVGHVALFPDTGQRPALAVPAGAVGPLRDDERTSG